MGLSELVWLWVVVGGRGGECYCERPRVTRWWNIGCATELGSQFGLFFFRWVQLCETVKPTRRRQRPKLTCSRRNVTWSERQNSSFCCRKLCHPSNLRHTTDAASKMDYLTWTWIIPRHVARLLTFPPIPPPSPEKGWASCPSQSMWVGVCICQRTQEELWAVIQPRQGIFTLVSIAIWWHRYRGSSNLKKQVAMLWSCFGFN